MERGNERFFFFFLSRVLTVGNGKVAYRDFLSSPVWQAKRKQRLRIDGFRCQQCGTQGLLDVHHLNYEKPWGQEEMSDLLSLCRECHYQQHEKKEPQVSRDLGPNQDALLAFVKHYPGVWLESQRLYDALYPVQERSVRRSADNLFRRGLLERRGDTRIGYEWRWTAPAKSRQVSRDLIPAPRKSQENTSFDDLRRVNENGEYWSARDLMPHYSYSTWQKFKSLIERAMLGL